jgi:hypothetical protein
MCCGYEPNNRMNNNSFWKLILQDESKEYIYEVRTDLGCK